MPGETYNIVVKVDPRGAETGTKRVDKALGRTEDRANKLRATLVRAFAFLGGVMVVRQGIGLLADYGQAMSTVQAITRTTGDQFAQLSEEAQRLGITTRFSATQAAEGMIFLARAGFEVDEVMASIGDTLNLAQAGALGLGQAADIASNVLQGFRLDVSQATRMVDVLAFTANNANTTVGQLGDGMKFVAPIASGLGISLEETAASMAALSDAGLQAGMAGTGLRRVLSELESPSARTRELLKKLGVAAEDVRPSVVGITQALDVLAASGITTAMALEMMGQRGGPAFEVLVSSIPKIKEMTKKLGFAGGEAARVAKIMDQNLKGALLGLKSAYEGLILRFGEAGPTAALVKMVKGLTGALRLAARNAEYLAAAVTALATVLTILLVKKAILLVIAKLTVMTSGVAGMTTAMAVAKPMVSVLTAKLAALRVVLMTNPFVLFTVGAVGAVAALVKLTRETGKFSKLMKGITERAELTKFAILGDHIMKTERAIKRVKKVLALRPEDKAAVQHLTRLEEKLKMQQKLSKAMIRVDNAVTAAKNASNKTYQDTFENLREEARLLKLSSKERDIQGQYVKIVKQLRDEGMYLTEQQQAELELRLWNNQVLGDQAAVLEEIRGEQEAETRRLGALNELFREGTITLEEYYMALEALPKEPSPFLERYRSMLAEIEGPQERFALDMEVLVQLVEDGAISMDQFNTRLLEMTNVAAEAGTSLSVGLSRGLQRIQEELNDVGLLAEDMLVNAFHSAEDALVKFVRTGQFEFMVMVDSMLDDIARLLVRLLILQAVQAVTGTGVPVPMQAGGLVQANRPYLVGEEGPEIFEPAGAGRIVPADQTAAMLGGGGTTVVTAPAPEVNVQVVTVQDPNEIPAAMDSPAGDKVILTALGRNKNSARRLLR